jgi:hypothetical protein
MAYNTLLKGKMFDPIDIEFEDGTNLKLSPVQITEIINNLSTDILFHDASKFSDEEFIPYRMRFHKTEEEDKKYKEDAEYATMVEDAFQVAWEHHYQHNNHHTKFWMYDEVDGKLVKRDSPKPMSVPAILHMICDWSAMSIKFQDTFSPISWYKTCDEKFEMHPNTRKVCEYFLNILFNEKF